MLEQTLSVRPTYDLLRVEFTVYVILLRFITTLRVTETNVFKWMQTGGSVSVNHLLQEKDKSIFGW